MTIIPNQTQRLGLGTVQFGQRYGISNARGQVSTADVGSILVRAANADIQLLDTAAAYGDAERVLGEFAHLTQPFQIVTKTLSLKNGLDAVVARARKSVEILRRQPVDTLLVHSTGDLAMPEGPTLWRAMQNLRDEGLYRAIGISAYFDDDPVAIAEKYRPDVMQIPFSLFDQRMLAGGGLARLKNLSVEIHVRSVFLQGLLFLTRATLPEKLKGAAAPLERIRRQIAVRGATPLRTALSFALLQPEIDRVVVGVTSPSELDEILTATQELVTGLDWQTFAIDDPVILTPSLW